MNFKKNLALYTLSFALIVLAGAIAFFALEVRSVRMVRMVLPQAAKSLDLKIKNSNWKSILTEVRETQKLIPSALKEVKKVREVLRVVTMTFTIVGGIFSSDDYNFSRSVKHLKINGRSKNRI